MPPILTTTTANITYAPGCNAYFCDGDLIYLRLSTINTYLFSCVGCGSQISPWTLLQSTNPNVTIDFTQPTTFLDAPLWFATLHGQPQAWRVEYVSDSSIRLIAYTGRYLQAVAATSSDSDDNAFLTSVNAAFLNVDPSLSLTGTTFNILPGDETDTFYLQSELGGYVGYVDELQPKFSNESSSAYSVYCADQAFLQMNQGLVSIINEKQVVFLGDAPVRNPGS